MIEPKQLATINLDTENINVEDILDTDNILGWLDNYFIFRDVPLKDIMHTLSKWYGEDLVIKDNMDRNITAQFKKDTPLKEILESLGLIIGAKLQVL